MKKLLTRRSSGLSSLALAAVKAMIVASMLCALIAGAAWAQWSGDPTVNTPICTTSGDQYLATSMGNNYGIYASIPDGSGGVLTVGSGLSLLPHHYRQHICRQRQSWVIRL